MSEKPLKDYMQMQIPTFRVRQWMDQYLNTEICPDYHKYCFVEQEARGRFPEVAAGAGGGGASPRSNSSHPEEEALGHGDGAQRADRCSAESQTEAGEGEGGVPAGG